MAGIKVIKINIRTSTARKGMTSLVNLWTGTPVMEQVVNINVPRGGVTPAIVRFKTITIPKRTGSTPNTFATGASKGTGSPVGSSGVGRPG